MYLSKSDQQCINTHAYIPWTIYNFIVVQWERMFLFFNNSCLFINVWPHWPTIKATWVMGPTDNARKWQDTDAWVGFELHTPGLQVLRTDHLPSGQGPWSIKVLHKYCLLPHGQLWFQIRASYKLIENSEKPPQWLGSACFVPDMLISQRQLLLLPEPFLFYGKLLQSIRD